MIGLKDKKEGFSSVYKILTNQKVYKIYNQVAFSKYFRDNLLKFKRLYDELCKLKLSVKHKVISKSIIEIEELESDQKITIKKLFNNDDLKQIKLHQNIVVEDLDKEIDEKLFYTLFNIIDQDNKYLIVTTIDPIVNFKFELDDLNSRSKNFLLQNIEKPDDELIFALLLKNLSDRQITLEKKLIDYIIKKIDRSYDKIFDFIYKIDEISLKKKKPIDLKIIKEVLGE